MMLAYLVKPPDSSRKHCVFATVTAEVHQMFPVVPGSRPLYQGSDIRANLNRAVRFIRNKAEDYQIHFTALQSLHRRFTRSADAW